MYKKECFGFKFESGKAFCKALNIIDCENCRFYKTKQEYEEKVKPLEHHF